MLHRNYSNEEFIRSCKVLKDLKISFSVNVIIGFPFETREMIFDSIRLLKDIRPDGVSTHIYNPYHGSEMRMLCEQNGLISKDLIAEDFFQADYCLKNPTITKSEILGLFRTIPLYIEFGEKEYKRIEKAEKFTEEGNRIFNDLKNDFYSYKKWNV